MATLTVHSVARVGVAPTYAAAAGGGDAAPVGDRNWIQVKNTSGAPITVTIATNPNATPFAGTSLSVESFSVPATTGDIIYGPLTPQLYADVTTGMATITYSGVTNLTIGVFSLSS
jgi:hypothetical protein